MTPSDEIIIGGVKYTPKKLDDCYTELLKPVNLGSNPPNGNSDFSLEDKADYWTTNGVLYNNGIYSVDLSKALLPSGTQNDHAERRIQSRANNGFYTPDYSLQHAVINAWHQNRDGKFKDKIEHARQSLAESINGKWLMTLTRLSYDPSGRSLINHNYKQSDSYQEKVDNFEGPDGDITSIANVQDLMQALLSTKQSVAEILNIYNWFRGLPSYLWRIDSKPKNIIEKAAGFYALSDWSGFDCYGLFEYSDCSFGVRVRKI